MILYNGRIYTLDPKRPVVSAILIRGDRVLTTGSNDEILKEANGNDEIIDLQDKTVLPGLTDSHLHLDHYSRFLQQINCETDTIDECISRVAERAHVVKPGEWVLGYGWNHNVWAKGYGNAEDLDRAAGEIPVFLGHKALHSAWVNSAALRIAGLTPSSPDPEGGKILRDSRGHPNGILLESAVQLVEEQIPKRRDDEIVDSLLSAQTKLWQYGITGVHDFDGAACFNALQILDCQDKLRLRVLKSIPFEGMQHAIELGLRSGFGGKYLRIGSVKLFADGALGPQTAAMLQPYENTADQMGSLFLDAEKIIAIGLESVKNGLSLAIHAIGDRANREVLNAFEDIRRYENENKIPALRHRIEHVQCLAPDDIKRLTKLNLVASMQPLHATSDMLIADQHWGKRAQYAYAWNALVKNHIVLAFGSDAPVESPNPFLGIHSVVTRRRIDGTPGTDGWYPEQRLSFRQGLEGYTTGAAFAANRENDLGRLQPGFFADMILLNADPFALPPQEIFKINPYATMVGGEWVCQT